MPFVNVKLVEGVFSPEEKHALAEAITDVLVKFEGSEAFRETVWVLIEYAAGNFSDSLMDLLPYSLID